MQRAPLFFVVCRECLLRLGGRGGGLSLARRLVGLERSATSRFLASQQLREVTKCQRLGRFSFKIDRGISLNATPLSGPRLRNQRTVG